LLGCRCGEGATAATEEEVDGSKDWVFDNGTNNGHQAGAAWRATVLFGLENSGGELHGDRDKGRKDSATVGAKDAEDDIVSSDPELQAGWLSLVRVVIKRGEVLQCRAVTELILVLCLDHGWSLCPECPHGLEDIHHALILHPLQHDA